MTIPKTLAAMATASVLALTGCGAPADSEATDTPTVEQTATPSQEPAEQKTPIPAIPDAEGRLHVDDLLTEFESDPATAEEKYMGKTFTVVGTVDVLEQRIGPVFGGPDYYSDDSVVVFMGSDYDARGGNPALIEGKEVQVEVEFGRYDEDTNNLELMATTGRMYATGN